jgi:outer membrane protein TolC
MKKVSISLPLMVWLSLFLHFLFIDASGQTYKLTLQDAVAIGLQNRPDLKNQQLYIEVAQTAELKNRGLLLPKIASSGNVRYNTQLPSTVLPEDFFGPGSKAQQIRFGTTNNIALSLDATQTIYNPVQKEDVRIARKKVAIEQASLQQTAAEIKLQITEAYYQALFKKEELAIAQTATGRAKQLFEIARVQFAMETIKQTDVNKVKLDFLNADTRLRRAHQNLQFSLDQLANQLNLQWYDTIELSDKFDDISNTGDLPHYIETIAVDKPEIRKMILIKEVAQSNLKRADLGRMPIVSANYSVQYQNNRLHLFDKNNWSPFNYVGLQLTLPIFNSNVSKWERRELLLRRQIAENDIANEKRRLKNQLQAVTSEYRNAQLSLSYARENYRLAQEVYENDKKMYELGTLLYANLLETGKSLSDAENNVLMNIFDFLVAKARLLKAKGE